MKKLLTIAAASTALILGATSAQAESRMERGEARLASLLEGRVAGEPQSCISTFRSNGIRVIPYVGVIYDAGDTVYVARAVRPQNLRASDVPVFERFGSQLCRNDVIRTMDRHANYVTGTLFLEDFIPYTRVEDAEG